MPKKLRIEAEDMQVVYNSCAFASRNAPGKLLIQVSTDADVRVLPVHDVLYTGNSQKVPFDVELGRACFL